MSCGNAGKRKSIYTGNQVGWFNFTGLYNYTAGGPDGSGLAAGTTVVKFIPNGTNRRPWLRQDAQFDDKLLDACWPTIGMQWFVEITLEPGVVFRVSNTAFYVQDEEGLNRFVDARVERPPSISVTVGEWLNPNYEVSDASLTLNNRDGYYNPWLPLGDDYRQWSGAEVKVFIGFGEKRSNYFTLFEGQITTKQGLSTTRDSIEIKAYDKLDLDEVPMPPRVYSIDNFPDIDLDSGGKPIPLIYGDWTDDVANNGSVNATCLNAGDDDAVAYIFKVSDIELESLDAIYLHRGKRKEGEPGGAISMELAAVTIDLPNGQFAVPKGLDVLDSEISYADNSTAGVGSGLNLITATDASVDFVAQKVQPGDRVIKRSTGQVASVSLVTTTQLALTGGVTFTESDEYVVLTRKYAFVRGDKVTVKCKGKPLHVQSVDRITDISSTFTKPNAISVGVDYSYWLADDNTQKIYNITFEDVIVKDIDYADIDPALTTVSSISIASDNNIWIVGSGIPAIYRYNHEADVLGLTILTVDIVGIATPLLTLQGVAAQSNNKFWIVDQASGDFFEVDPFSAVQPFVTRSFNISDFEPTATEILDLSVDEVNDQLVTVDRFTNMFYRVEADGTLIQATDLTELASNVAFVTGVSVAQDASLFFVDRGTLTIYNYNEQSDASTNPAFIARDLMQKFGGHNFGHFDLTWNDTARQLQDIKCRVSFDKTANLVTFVNKLLNQYNVVFHLRFGRLALFWIEFNNFRANGKFVGEKDIKDGSFKPTKEMNQYFNSATATYNLRPFTGNSSRSDTYVSPAAVTFAGKEVNRILDMPNVYKREDLDRLMPLFVKLSAPEPEFVDVVFGFRIIRSQMQDFLQLHFDGDVNCITGRKESGRRYDHVPCMVRKLAYDLGPMTVSMKVWSLGNTAFGDYFPVGKNVGGQYDTIVLSNLGRLGRVSPIGTILSAGSEANSIVVEDVGGLDAANRQNSLSGKTWETNYLVDIVDGTTKEILQTLTVISTTGGEIFFNEDVTVSLTPTVKNIAGFITGGHYLQYSEYPNLINAQKQIYASFSRPTNNYPTTRTQELEEQRAGEHGFDDGGLPYVLYPIAFIAY